MVEKLFADRPPTTDSVVLDPGCGPGAFIEGVIRWCGDRGVPMPQIVGIESDPHHASIASERFSAVPQVRIVNADFLNQRDERYDYVIGNPPYVPITALDVNERESYRKVYRTARGRFDLYLLFFEQALSLLRSSGRMVFVTPEKFLYVQTAEPLRRLLGNFRVNELHFLDESTFVNLVTYPLVTTITAGSAPGDTTIVHRDGRNVVARLTSVLGSWLPVIRGGNQEADTLTLTDICVRISCGVATGADSVYLVRTADLDPRLRSYARPTVAGRQLGPGKPLSPIHSLLLPYSDDGRLLPEDNLGELGHYLSEGSRRARLEKRTCVSRKPWYAYHETPPLNEALRPKILCKDIGAAPFFISDLNGAILPRHSVYYIVPRSSDVIPELTAYLNSAPTQQWLRDHCQRADKDFVRLQSHVLKRLPLPARFERLRHTDSQLRIDAEAIPA